MDVLEEFGKHIVPAFKQRSENWIFLAVKFRRYLFKH